MYVESDKEQEKRKEKKGERKRKDMMETCGIHVKKYQLV